MTLAGPRRNRDIGAGGKAGFRDIRFDRRYLRDRALDAV
ncbi:hypothetical protein U91I_02323 [alpha proteobacterium U9-1i]|nr:hypothetical protein U91I_02323 [alpha proteobacterium U9-1i]